ncbi:MAG: hypothetical protein P8181_16545 [bacterium]
MTRLILLGIAVVALGAGAAAAQQGGSIGIFADTQGNDCDIFDNAVGLRTYYVCHVYTAGATASQFSAPKPSCMLASWLSDTAVFPVTIGNSQSGVAIGYGSCQVGPIHILSINFFCQGLTPLCCYYPVLPDPSNVSGNIEVVDCDNNLLMGTGFISVVNPDQSCCCHCTPADESTWGKVKSLYSN